MEITLNKNIPIVQGINFKREELTVNIPLQKMVKKNNYFTYIYENLTLTPEQKAFHDRYNKMYLNELRKFINRLN